MKTTNDEEAFERFHLFGCCGKSVLGCAIMWLTKMQLKFVEFDVSRFAVEREVVVGWIWRRMCEK